MDCRLSPSLINLFLECPKCFWLQVVQKIKRPEGVFPSLPNGMDRVLKVHFDWFMERGDFPPEIREYCVQNGYQLFDNVKKLTVWRNNFEGIRYIDDVSGFVLRGTIDNILAKNGKLIVLDYKTRGFPAKENTHEFYQTQLDIYNFLLRKNGHETEEYSYLLFYHPGEVLRTGEVVFHAQLKKIQIRPENGEKVVLAALNAVRLENPPESSPSCAYCNYVASRFQNGYSLVSSRSD